MCKFVRVSEIFNEFKVSLKINRTTNENNYDVLQLQTESKLIYSSEKGINCLDKNHNSKIRNFLELAKQENSALVLTPECSVPFEIIYQIITDIEKWPEQYNLWCLCSEGLETNQFKSIVEKIRIQENVKLIIEDRITYSKHVNALWYLFKINQDKLGIIIQLKQEPMADRELKHEGCDLSQGNTVYIFDLNDNKPTKNLLITLICADAIQMSSSEIISALKESYPIVVNPQLNPQPFSKYFITFRNSFFSDTSISKQRSITVNWAKDTMINSKSSILESGSTYYNYIQVNGKNHIDAISKDAELFIHRSKCQKKGMSYFCDENYNLWNIGNDDQCIHYYIKKEDVFGFNQSLGIQFDPLVKNSYYFDNIRMKWEVSNKIKCLALEIYNRINSFKTNKSDYLPINYSICSNKKCEDKCEWLYNDYFFGVCFGNFLRGEIETKYEISQRTVLELNNDSKRYTIKKRKLFLRLVELLKNNNFPKSLIMYKDNHKFDIDYSAAKSGSDSIYNVAVKEIPVDYPSWRYKKAVFVICDLDDISEVEELYDKIRSSTKVDYRDQIVIYYKSEIGFVYYDIPHQNHKIGSGNVGFTNGISSIIGGHMKYEQS